MKSILSKYLHSHIIPSGLQSVLWAVLIIESRYERALVGDEVLSLRQHRRHILKAVRV